MLDIFDEEGLLERAVALGTQLRAGLDDLAKNNPLVGEVRGLGPMLALELVKDAQTREPASAETTRVVEHAREQGLLLMKAGLHGNVIRILVPLTADERDVSQGLELLRQALGAALKAEARPG